QCRHTLRSVRDGRNGARHGRPAAGRATARAHGAPGHAPGRPFQLAAGGAKDPGRLLRSGRTQSRSPPAGGGVGRGAHSVIRGQGSGAGGRGCVTVTLLAWIVLLTPAAANDGAPVQDEILAYNINYPSGLSLGESRIISHKSNDRWYFEMVLDAGVP